MVDTCCAGGQEIVVHHLSETTAQESFLLKLCTSADNNIGGLVFMEEGDQA
jgi:hypothetical protein